ncbi:MAG: cyanoexosortase C [Thainema sp.]
MNSAKLKYTAEKAIALVWRSNHYRVVAIGCVIGVLYIPVWLYVITYRSLEGSSSVVLNVCFVGLGTYRLWQNRAQITKLQAVEEDRWIGYAFIIGGVVVYPFCLASPSLQSLVFILVAVGILLSSYGVRIFQRYWLSLLLLLGGFYPNYRFLAHTLWRSLTPTDMLESLMAQVGGFVLNNIGQSATVTGRIIELPGGAVDVGAGCSGFSMACALAGIGFVIGLFYQLRWPKTAGIMIAGIAISLTLNVPRIVLLAFAAIYWGEKSFAFWHDGWGSQIFATVMFTIYYYVIMAFVRQQPTSTKSGS